MNLKNRKHLDVALPNKVFEYIACGLPVLAFKHKNIMAYLTRHNVGLVFDTLDEMASQLQNRKKIRNVKGNVLNIRCKFTVEKNINTIIQYYKEMSASKAS
jgi:glycosyltransferase involved in cell wall biosynthesis